MESWVRVEITRVGDLDVVRAGAEMLAAAASRRTDD